LQQTLTIMQYCQLLYSWYEFVEKNDIGPSNTYLGKKMRI